MNTALAPKSCILPGIPTTIYRTTHPKDNPPLEDKSPQINDLFVLRLNVPVNNFSVMSGRSHRFLGN